MGEPVTFTLDEDGFKALLEHLTLSPYQRKLTLEVHKNDVFVMSYNVTDFSLGTIMDFTNRWAPEGYKITVKAENHQT